MGIKSIETSMNEKVVKKMKINYKLIILFLMIISLTFAGCSNIAVENGEYRNFTGEINGDNLLEVIEELSSDIYQGRLVGTKGNERAMDYVINRFIDNQVDFNEIIGDYVQDYYQLVNMNESEMLVEILNHDDEATTRFIPYENYREALFYPECDNNVEGIAEMILITNVDQLKNNTEMLKDKFLIIHKSLITSSNLYELFKYADNADAIGIGFNRDNKYNDIYYVKSRSMTKEVHINGFDYENGIACFYFDDPSMSVLESACENNYKIHFDLNFQMERVKTGNIIAEIKGNPGNETIIVGAHLDHIGSNNEGVFYPGALDNASGISTLIETARIVKNSKETPKKNIVFIAFNGEEVGLIGSRNYTMDPVYDLDSTEMINLDMVGSERVGTLSIESGGYASNDLRDDLIEIADDNDMENDFGENGGSDHVNFAIGGAEAVMLINYDLSDIHTPLDTVSRNIDIEYLKEIVDLILEYIDKTAY